jgi:hypothetical protein
MLAGIDGMQLASLAAPGCVPGRVVERGEDGTVSVAYGPDDDEVRLCRPLETAEGVTLVLAVGDEVLAWLPADDAVPGFILGRVASARAQPDATPAMEDVPETLVIEARQNLTLRCGAGSITLRADGRILIRGRDLVSHAQRMNRIKGGAVTIN